MTENSIADDGRRWPATPTTSSSDATLVLWPRLITVAAGDADHLYALITRCEDCASEPHASDDGGAGWQRRTEPPLRADVRGALLPSPVTVLGAQVLARVDVRLVRNLPRPLPPIEPAIVWISVDGGRTWNESEVDTEPIDAVPGGTRLVDCGPASQTPPCELQAIDPATGRIAPLAHQPTGMQVRFPPVWRPIADTPPGAGQWVQGLDPATGRPALAVSHDQGRTWTTNVFTEGPPAEARHGLMATMYQPRVASTDGQTAYVLIYGDDSHDWAIRTTDGGVHWQRVPGDDVLGRPYSSFVAGDGSHVVLRTSRPGAVEADHDRQSTRDR